MVKYPIILMDADGTLFDFDRSEQVALAYILQRYSLPNTQESRGLYHRLNDYCWDQYERGKLDKEQLLVERFAQLFGAFGATADFAQVNREYLEKMSQSSYTFADAPHLCAALAPNHKLYIVTNSTAISHRGRLAESPIKPYIIRPFVSEELGCNKPQKLFFDKVLDLLGNPEKSDVMLLGDSLTSDMQGGRNAGITTCWYNPKGLPKDQRCDYSITHLMDFLKIVE